MDEYNGAGQEEDYILSLDINITSGSVLHLLVEQGLNYYRLSAMELGEASAKVAKELPDKKGQEKIEARAFLRNANESLEIHKNIIKQGIQLQEEVTQLVQELHVEDEKPKTKIITNFKGTPFG